MTKKSVWYVSLFLFIGFLSVACLVHSERSSADNGSTEPNVAAPNKKDAGPVAESAQQKKEVLWDFRTYNTKSPTFSNAETHAVMSYLFGDTWDTDLGISSRVSGSFTKPHVNQTLYYVGGCNEDDGRGFKSTTNCAHVSWWNAGWIAIFEGSTPVMKVEAALGYEIAKVTDVNGDGVNEILSLSGYSNQGETDTSGALGQIVGGKYKEIKTLSGASDTCGMELKSEQNAKASVVTYFATTDGKMPDFTEEYFQNRCNNTLWKKITKQQFEGN